ncbi:MAG TPA: TIGR03905 family protein [Eubacterium sp.]|nr:TIGR03905 family protein [Eubacterium sp.]
MMIYQTKGTCSRAIKFDVEDGIVKNVQFDGGCNGNTQGVAILVEGMPIDEVIKKLKGINCNGRGTSCPDQLAIALTQYKENNN